MSEALRLLWHLLPFIGGAVLVFAVFMAVIGWLGIIPGAPWERDHD